MPISEQEKLRRHNMVQSVLGTNEMEGLFADSETLEIMHAYECGELTMNEFSARMDAHAANLVAQTRSLAVA